MVYLLNYLHTCQVSLINSESPFFFFFLFLGGGGGGVTTSLTTFFEKNAKSHFFFIIHLFFVFPFNWIFPYTVELWSLELICVEHNGSLALIRQSPQFLYIFNIKIHPRLEQRWLELKTWTAGQFLMYKCLAGSNQYLPNMNHSEA